MAKYLPLPDGSSVTIREGETPKQAWERAQRMYPEAFGARAAAEQPESGFTPSLKSSFSELKSGLAALAGRTGLMDTAAAEKYIKEQEEYQKRVFKPTATFGEAPITKTLELLGGSLPYTVAPLVIGGAAATAPVSAPVATALGLGAAGAASATQFTGSNLRAQMRGEEGVAPKTLAQTELAPAVAASIPQAAMDALSFKMMPGIRQILTAAGKEVSPAVAKKIAEQGVRETAKDYALATGRSMGVEGLTEVGQQFLERMQAGFNLTDERARDEYFDSLIGGAVLGGVLSPAGRYVERRGEAKKEKAAELEAAKELEAQQAAQREAEAAQRLTPEGRLAFVQDYEARLARYTELQAIKKPGNDASPLEKAEFAEVKKERQELGKQLQKDTKEYKAAKAAVADLLEQQRVAGMTPEDYMLEGMEEARGSQMSDTRRASLIARGLLPDPNAPAAPPAPAPRMRTVIDEFGQITEVPETAPEAEAQPVKEGELYLNAQVQAARGMGLLDVEDVVDFAMQDPVLAAQAVKEGAGVEGLSPQENGALLGGIRLRLKALEKQEKAATKAELAQRAEDLGAQRPGAGMSAEQQQLADLFEEQTTTLREGETNFDYLDPVFEKALGGEEVIKVDPNVTPVKNAAALRARITALEQEIAKAREEADAARRTRNPQAVVDARRKIASLNNQLGTMTQEGGAYVTQMMALRQQQQATLAALDDIADQLRSGQTLSGPAKEMAASTEQTLKNRAERERAALVTAALQEAALHRRAQGTPALTRDEALKAAVKLSDTVNEMMARASVKPAAAELRDAAKNLKPIREKVQRNGNTVRTYRLYDPETNTPVDLTIIRQKDGTVFRVFSRYADGKGGGTEFDTKYAKTISDADIIQKSFIDTEMFRLAKEVAPEQLQMSPAERKHFNQRLQTVIDNLTKVERAPATKVDEGILKQQFATTEAKKVAEARGETATTLSGELRRRTEFVREKMAKMGGMRPAARDALNRAADVMDSGEASRDLLDAVEPVVDAIVSKRNITQADIRAINDALAARKPTALEQKEAGQQALFPETDKDFGYIRATPANFAKSPRIKPVWEALANARAAKAKQDQEKAVRKARETAGLATIEKLEAQIDNIEQSTEFFWKNQPKWSQAKIAELFVPFPEIGQTPEEKALVDKYLSRAKMTNEESVKYFKLLDTFKTKHLAEYAVKLKQAQMILAQGGRLDAVENSLVDFAQSSSAKSREAAKALAERIAPLKTAIKQIKSMLRGTAVLTDAQKRVMQADDAVKTQRDEFQRAVERALMKSLADIEAARASLLDPKLAEVSKALEEAKATLDKEQAELDKIKKRFDEVLAQTEGRDRTQLATYQLFRYEEKKTIIDGLKAQVAEQEAALNQLAEERFGEIDGQIITVQAMLDKNVRMERDYLEMLEAQLASLRGENVIDQPNKYPFAARRAQLNVDAQKKQVQAAEKRADDFKKESTKTKEEVKQQWSGIRRVGGVVQSLDVIREQQRLDKLREENMRATMNESEKAKTDAEKQAVIDDIVEEQNQLALDIARYPGPMSREGLVNLLASNKPTDEEKALYTIKLDLLQKYSILDAQLDAIKEGKPKRPPRPATAPSTAVMSAQKPLRTGTGFEEEARERTREANLIGAAIRGTKAPPEPKPSTRVQRKPLDEYIGLFDEDGDVFPSRIKESSYAPDRVRYNGELWTEVESEEVASVLYDVLHEVGAKAPGPNNLSAAIASTREYYKSEIAVLEKGGLRESAQFYKDRLAVLNQLRIENFTVDARERPQKLVARPVARPSKPTVSPTAPFGPEKLARLNETEIDTEAAFNGMTFAEAARYGAKRTTSPMVRMLFDRLAEVFDSAPPELAGKVYAASKVLRHQGQPAAGVYIGRTNEILTISPSHRSGQANKTLLHELTHAATVYALNLSPELNAQVEALRQRVVDWLETPAGRAYFRAHSLELGKNRQSIYGLTNNKEFLAELFADRGFQKMLTQIPSGKPRKSIFTRFVEALSKFFNVPGEAGQSLFAEAVALTEDVLNFTLREVYSTPNVAQIASGKYDVQPLLMPQARYASPEMAELGKSTDRMVARQRTMWEKIKANTSGLAFETKLVDRFAGFERLAKYMEPLKGSQMLYYMRMYDQRMNAVAQSVSEGAPQLVEKTRADGRKEFVLETKPGPSIKGVVETLRGAQKHVGNAEAVNRMFTKYLAAIRAQRVGLAALNFGGEVTQDMLDATMRAVDGNPELKRVFEAARAEYNSYNRNMMKFLADTGAISESLAQRLSSTNDYIPFYREQNGNAMLIISGESPIKIGSIAEQPYLQELVGGDEAILDFMTSSVQNTNMLVDMGLRNLATKNAVFELINLNAAKIVKGRPSGADVVKFKVDGEDRYAVLDTETVTVGGKKFDTGVPAELLVKGMEGIPAQMPFAFRVLAMPAQLLRKAVTLSPLYMAKQVFRDSLAAPIVSGANFTPVLGALRQIGSPAAATLESRFVTGGQYMTGTSEDLSKILRDVASGKPGWMSALSKFEAMGMAADALTRRAQYNSYIAQGMSEMEATLMALESMNFNKRGASPSIHILNSLIPFLNAQIQGLNVLYKAFTGKLPFNDKLKIQQKLLLRGGMLAAASMVYAALMEDDEAYKNATPDQKYGNWFIRLPGLDEPVRLPVPFEIGYIFKALPEAIYNTMTQKEGGEEAIKAFKQILLQTIPGGSSYGLPQAIKPAIEAGLGKSFYTGRDILSAREKELLPEEQFRANTSEIAKAFGKTFDISPVMMEYVVRGYTGTLGLAFLHALSLGAPKSESPEAAVKRLSDYPLVGGAFQPNDAGGIINSVYERFNEDIKVRNSYKKLVDDGRMAEATNLLQRRSNEIMEAEIGDSFKTNMNKLTQAERAIAASNMSPEEKRKQLDEIRKIKTGLAKTYREVADKTTPQ